MNRLRLPLRLQVAINVLRGRPTVYRFHFVGCDGITVSQADTLVVECSGSGGGLVFEPQMHFSFDGADDAPGLQ